MIQALIDFFKEFLKWDEFWQSIKNLIKDFIIWIQEAFINAIASIIEHAVSVLPNWSPLSSLAKPETLANDFINGLNWVFPVGYAISMIGVIITWLMLYVTIGTVVRRAKIL